MPPTTSTPLLVNGVGSDWTRTVSNSVIGLSSIPTGVKAPNYALIQVETNSIRLTEDGTTPTTSNGYLLSAGMGFESYVPGSVKMIRATGSDATIQVGYYN